MPVPFDPLAEGFLEDPYPAYGALREHAPLQDTGLGSVLVSRYEDCLAVLRHPAASSDFRKLPGWAPPPGRDPAEVVPSFLNLDPPDHTRLRALVGQAFLPRRIERLRPAIADAAGELLDRAGEAGELEVVGDLAFPLPARVVSELLGVPRGDLPLWREWSPLVARTLDPWPLIPGEERPRLRSALEATWAYFEELVADRRRQPRDDLISALAEASETGALRPGELVRTLTLLMVAGQETTVQLIANGVLAFARHPEQLARLRRDPSLLPAAVEEVLRFDPPVQLDSRFLLEQAELPSGSIPRHREAVLLLGAANRDPARFAEPDRFELARQDKGHLGFGFGIHRCLGAALARAEGQAALGELARRFSGFELLEDPPPYRPHVVLRGVERLQVRVARR